jgi:hypothetical protein
VYPEVPRTYHNGVKGTFMDTDTHNRYVVWVIGESIGDVAREGRQRRAAKSHRRLREHIYRITRHSTIVAKSVEIRGVGVWRGEQGCL